MKISTMRRISGFLFIAAVIALSVMARGAMADTTPGFGPLVEISIQGSAD